MWFALAKKEVRHLLYRRGTWIYTVLCVAYTLIWLNYPRGTPAAVEAFGADTAIGSLQAAMGIMVMFGGLVAGFRAIVGERESGTIGFVGGMPHTRQDIVLGKLVGRTAIVSIGVFASVGCIVVVGGLLYGLFSPLKLLAVTAVTIVYAFCWVAIGLTISALSTSSTEAIVGVLVASFLSLQWRQFSWLVHDSLGFTDSLTSHLLVSRLAPREVYHVVTNWILGIGNADDVFYQVLVQIETDSTVLGLFLVDDVFETVPLYLTEWMSLIILLLWILVPLIVAAVRVNRMDLAKVST